MESVSRKVIRLALLAIIGGAFLYAGIAKALDPGTFATDIAHYRLGTWWQAVALAFYLPFLEIIAAGALFFPNTRQAALLVLLCLTSIFTAALFSAELRHLDISCGCFGASQPQISIRFALGRNCLFLTVLYISLRWARR